MQSNRFVVLTGHLSNYPLSELVGILRHQRKSGRLLIEYPKGPATFFFQNGELIDARLNELSGLQAICVALAQPEASFNFNPLVQSPRRSIDPSLQCAVAELFGCWDESPLQIETTAATPALEAADDGASTPHCNVQWRNFSVAGTRVHCKLKRQQRRRRLRPLMMGRRGLFRAGVRSC